MKIQTYQAHIGREAPVAFAPQTEQSSGADFFRNIAAAAEKTETLFAKAYARDEQAAAQNDVAAFEAEQERTLLDLQEQADIDGANFHQTFMEQFRKQKENLLNGKSSCYRAAAAGRLQQVENAFSDKTLTYEAFSRRNKRIADTEDMIKNEASMVTMNPAEYQIRFDQTMQNIDQTRLPTNTRLRLTQKAEEAFQEAPVAYAYGLIEKNQEAARAFLYSEQGEKLIPDAHKRMQLKNMLGQVENRRKKEADNPFAAVQTLNNIKINADWDSFKDSHKKEEMNNDLAVGILQRRANAYELANKELLDKKDYQTFMQKTALSLVEAVENNGDTEQGAIKGLGRFRWWDETVLNKGVDFFKSRWPNMTTNQKAYVYTELYKRIVAAGLDPNADKNEGNNHQMITKIARQLEKETIEDAAAGVIDSKASRVLIGDDLLIYGEE